MTQVAPGVFCLRLPVPFKLDHVNAYLVDTGGGHVLIDTGVRTPESLAALEAGLRGIGDRGISTIVVTHFHPDHSGQAGLVRERSGAPIVMGRPDAVLVEDLVRRGRAEVPPGFFAEHGVPPPMAAAFAGILGAAGSLMGPFAPDRTVVSGDPIAAGRRLVALLTPGHTPGHLSVHLPDEGLLFSGDHVLPHISPHVGLYSLAHPDPLGDYLGSLEEVIALAPGRIFPAHGPVIEDPAGRVRELIAHHRERLERLRAAAAPDGLTTWQAVDAVWGAALDVMDGFLAFFEGLAHLEHLVAVGDVFHDRVDSRVVYRAAR